MSLTLSAGHVALLRANDVLRLPHRCDIYRSTASGSDDEEGNPVYGAPALFAANVACSYSEFSSVGERRSVTQGEVVVGWQVSFPVGTDIHERDEIRNVRDQAGSVLSTRPLDVNVVTRNSFNLLATAIETRAV